MFASIKTAEYEAIPARIQVGLRTHATSTVIALVSIM